MGRVRTTLNKPTRARSAVDALRALILDGDLAPGERLQEQMLAEKLGTSRTPVKTALTTLAGEGLLFHEPHCGYVVRQFDIQDVIRATDVRMVLEGLAARSVASRSLDETTEIALRANLLRSRDVLFDANWNENSQKEWFRLNREFHDLILARADNPYLTNLVRQVRVIPIVYDHVRSHDVGDLRRLYRREQSQQALVDHTAIFEALIQRQAERAEFLLKDHVFKNREDMIRNFEDVVRSSEHTKG